MSKMKVALMSEVGKIEIVERDIPTINDDEVLVRIKHCGVCGSDVHYYEHGRIGDFVVEKPIVLGHEAGGIVEQVGKNVKTLKVGDKVALEPGQTCGKCEFCKAGRYNLCADVEFLATPPFDGAFLEYIAYPADMAFKLPENMTTMEGSLVEPLSVGFHAANQADASAGQTAVVLGSGCIGLCTLMALQYMGVAEVYVADVIDKRLEVAKKLGATGVINASKEDTIAKIKELTGGKGVDLVFETAGTKITTQQTPKLVKIGGTITLVGMAPDAALEYNLGEVLMKEARITTVFRYRNVYPMVIAAIASGRLPAKDIVSNTFPLEKTEEAIKFNIKNKSDTVKIVIEI